MKILLVDQIAKVNYKYSYSLAQAIADEGNEVVLAIDQKEEPEHCTCRMLRLFNTDEKNIGKVKKLTNYIDSYKAIYEELKKGKYDVLHTQWLIFSPVDYYYLKKISGELGIKLVVTIHDILPFNQKFYDFTYHKRIYALADRVIVQADNNIKRFDELFPELAGKEMMIPHGHFLEYAEIIDKTIARNKLNISDEKFVFLFFGQIKKVKGVGVLLEAFSKIFQEHPGALLIIAGSVWKDDFSLYQEIIDKSNMGNSVMLDIRYIPDDEVKYYYAASDCCVLPYLDVYQSGVIQLCYAHKKPVIATNIGAFKEVVVDTKTGFLCEAEDPDDLAEKMILAMHSQGELGHMAEEGYKYIADKFSWEKIAKKTIEFYA